MPKYPGVSRRTVLQHGLGSAVLLTSAQGKASQTRAQPVGEVAYTPRVIDAAGAQADVELLIRALRTIHPGLTRRRSAQEIEAGFAQLRAAVRVAVSEFDFYRELSALLAVIQCSHTKADVPSAFERWRREQASHLPLRLRWLQGRMIVVSCVDSAMARGSEVLAINGRPVADWMQTLGRFVSVDGHTPWARDANLTHDGDLMGSGLDHFMPFVAGLPTRFEFEWAGRDERRERTLALAPASFEDWLKLPNEGRPWRANFAEATSWRLLRPQVGYLRVGTFVNYRKPVDAQALFSRAMSELQSQGARQLIVDLRDNGGGSDDAALALLDHLVMAPYTYQRAMRLKAIRYGDLEAYIETWGDRQALFQAPESQFKRTPEGWYERRAEDHPALLQPRPPAAAAFKGDVTVLTSPVNASGATMVIAKLHDLGRAKLVGGRCGGSADGPTAGRIFSLLLPATGIRVRIPVVFNVMAVDRFDPRGGISPDVLVEETVEDFRAGRDGVLAHVLSTMGEA